MPLSQSTKPRRILLVEDSELDAGLIEEKLEHHVLHVTRLSSAVHELRVTPVDAILLDIRLPDGIGVDCVKAIRAEAGDSPIIVLTGLEDDELALDCLESGAQDFLSKDQLDARSLNRSIGYAVARNLEVIQRRRADALQRDLLAMVKASSDAIISVHRNGAILSWNRGAEDIFGYSSEEAVGRDYHEVLIAPDPQAADRRELLLSEIFQGRANGAEEVVRLHKNGRPLTLSVVYSPIPDVTGEIGSTIAVCRDITEQRLQDEKLRRMNDELLNRDRLMRLLAARLQATREEERTRLSRKVHDELGQLLTGLKMDLNWIGRRLTEQGPLMNRIQEADKLVDRTIRTVQQIALELRPAALDALGLTAAIRDEARRFGRRAGIGVTTDGLEELGDPPKTEVSNVLFRILQELLANVARHAQASRVRISLCEESEDWVLSVVDDGVGISSAAALQPSSLGLLGAGERAEALGGRFNIAPNVGGGTKATVRVPRVFEE